MRFLLSQRAEIGWNANLAMLHAVYHYHVGFPSSLSVRIGNANVSCRPQSDFDSFHWQSTYGDPTYERHVAIARVLGLTAARLADDLVLPINITGEWGRIS